MPRPSRLLPCPSCARHIKAIEPQCPHCGAAVRQADGSVQRSAAALLLGLTTAVAACGETAQPVYGAPSTGGSGGSIASGGSGGGGSGGAAATGGAGGTPVTGGTGGTAGAGGDTSQPVYGAAPTGGGQ